MAHSRGVLFLESRTREAQAWRWEMFYAASLPAAPTSETLSRLRKK